MEPGRPGPAMSALLLLRDSKLLGALLQVDDDDNGWSTRGACGLEPRKHRDDWEWGCGHGVDMAKGVQRFPNFFRKESVICSLPPDMDVTLPCTPSLKPSEDPQLNLRLY